MISCTILLALATAARAVATAGASAPEAQLPDVRDLPLIEVPSSTPGPRMALLISADGGWVAPDKKLAAELASRGVSVIGLDSLHYFWKRRTPEQTTRDVERILARYTAAWGRPEVLLVGYSRGADVAPIVAGRLTPEVRGRLKLVAMLGPATFAELEVHAIDLFTSKKRKGAISTEEAVRATAGAVPMLCVYGDDEHDSLCPHVADLPWVQVMLRPGGHRLRGGYEDLAQAIVDAAG